MDLRATKSFSSPYTGNVSPGQVLKDLPQSVAVHFVENDLCEFIGKRKIDTPLVDGPGKQSLSSQAGPASQPNSVNTSDSSTPPAGAESSPLTQAGNAPLGATPSTQSTGAGGQGTPKKRRTPRKK